MKGLVLLFLVISFGIIGWKYMDSDSKKSAKRFVSKNIWPIVMASFAVSVAIFISTNTTLRIV